MGKKKVTRYAAVVAGLTLFLAGCGGDDANEAASDDPTAVEGNVLFWTYPIGVSGEDGFWDPIIAEFNEQYPNVEIEVVVQPFQKREETLVTAIAGNQAPDVVYLNPNYIPRFGGDNLLEPVGDLVDDEFNDAAVDSMTWDGEVYSVPLLMQIFQSVCNRAVLDAAGVDTCPETWDQLKEIAPAVKDAGFYPTHYEGALGVTLTQTFYPYLWQAGGEVLNEDGTEAAFNSPEGVKALEFLAEFASNEWIAARSLTVLDPFEQTPSGKGETAYLPSTSLTSLRGVGLDETIEVVPPLKDVEQVAAGSVGGLSIMSSSEVKPAARAWVEFMTSAEQMGSFVQATGYFPARDSITGLFDDDPKFADGQQYLHLVRAGIGHPEELAITDLISPHVQAALLGRVSPADALAAAETEVNDLLARRG